MDANMECNVMSEPQYNCIVHTGIISRHWKHNLNIVPDQKKINDIHLLDMISKYLCI